MRGSLVAQQVKDPALSLQQLRSLLWHGSIPGPGTYMCHRHSTHPPRQKKVALGCLVFCKKADVQTRRSASSRHELQLCRCEVVLMDQQYMFDKVSLSRDTHKTRFCMNSLMTMSPEAGRSPIPQSKESVFATFSFMITLQTTAP